MGAVSGKDIPNRACFLLLILLNLFISVLYPEFTFYEHKILIMGKSDFGNVWKQSKADIFWGEIAPCNHVIQIYESDAIFLDVLAGFVGGGINAGDACIIIASRAHLSALDERLTSCGVQLKVLIDDHRYIPLDAEEMLDKFMINDWPDEELFMKTVTELINLTGKKGRKVRAFGEMVAVLWANGHNGATVQLEHLWNRFCEKESFSLFCAYPKTGFTDDINASILHICGAHSKMIAGDENQITEISYRDITEAEQIAANIAY